MSSPLVRYGIAGFGRHAVKRLMPGFATAQKSRATALTRRKIADARSSAREFDIPLAFDSTAAMARSPEVDAIFIASPDALHLQDALDSFAAGKAVLCEKPMAMNAAEALQMVTAAQLAGVLLGVAQVFRFNQSVNRAREIVASGELGAIRFASLEFHYLGTGHPRQWLTDAALACGGPMADVGVHCIDALRYILQQEVVRVRVEARQDAESGPFECAATIFLDLAHGTEARVAVSTRADYHSPLSLQGAGGTLDAADALNVIKPIVMNIRAGSTTRQEQALNIDAYARQVDAFSAWLLDGTPFPAPGSDGVRNQLILDAAYRSWRSGRAEPVPA